MYEVDLHIATSLLQCSWHVVQYCCFECDEKEGQEGRKERKKEHGLKNEVRDESLKRKVIRNR